MNAAAIVGIVSAIEALVKLYGSTVAAAKQDQELTPEQEAAFQAKLSEMFASPAWQIAEEPKDP